MNLWPLGTGTTRREAWVRVRRRRPPALSLALDNRLRRAPNRTAGFPRAVWSGERSLLASGSPALANRLRAHYAKRSEPDELGSARQEKRRTRKVRHFCHQRRP